MKYQNEFEAYYAFPEGISVGADGKYRCVQARAAYAAFASQQEVIDGMFINPESMKPLEWTSGIPKGFAADEWFLAKLSSGRVAALKALPEEWSYDYTTADETYFKADCVKKWMPLPKSQFLTPSEYYEKQIKELTEERDTLIMSIERLQLRLVDIVEIIQNEAPI